MKKTFIFAILIIVLSACSAQEATVVDKKTPVKVQIVKLEERDTTQKYVGTVNSSDLIKYSFKTGGVLSDLQVSVGDEVKKGDLLASLNTSDLSTAVTVAKSQMESAKAQYDKALSGGSPQDQKLAELNLKKAQDAYDYALENLEKSEKLYDAGAISESQIKQIRLEVEILKSDLEQAQEVYTQSTQSAREEDLTSALANYNQAKANYEHNLRNLEDSKLKSTINGYVASIQFEQGELVGSGYPVVIVRSSDQVISFGISQKDVNEAKLGAKAKVKIFKETVEGELISISEIPNDKTGIYDAKVAVEKTNFKLGMIADIELITGVSQGIWVPLNTIKYVGSNYVFVAQDDRVVRKNITILEQQNGRVRVSGLAENDFLIVTNSNIVKPGDLIEIIGS
ncbi:MAG: efflux RND transporter periplasmic adaptor subunit [Clostridia bacterium]